MGHHGAMNKSKRVAYLGVAMALGMILSYIETLIPFYFGVPGMKLGLCNVLVVFLLYRLGAKDALFMNIGRILLTGFMFGNAYSILYSLAGAIVSFTVMLVLKKTDRFSVWSVSVAGGFSHNIGQLFAAAVVVENYHVFFYAPALMICGIITGAVIGVVAEILLIRLASLA